MGKRPDYERNALGRSRLRGVNKIYGDYIALAPRHFNREASVEVGLRAGDGRADLSSEAGGSLIRKPAMSKVVGAVAFRFFQ